MKIKQDIENGRMYNIMVVLERARNMSLANNFVTDLTSLVVVINDGARNSDLNTFRIGGSDDGRTPGMSTPIDTTFNVSSLIWPEEKNSTASSSCNITFYSADHHQGDGLTFSYSVPDLSVWDFEEKLESLKVEGPCDWKIFTGEIVSLSLSL